MADKVVQLPDIGSVTIRKHRRARSVRIALLPNGEIRVTIPWWTPYATGIAYTESKRDWILQHRTEQSILQNGSAIGKAHHIYFAASDQAKTVQTKTIGSQIRVVVPSHMSFDDPAVQKAAKQHALKSLRAEAEKLLPMRVERLAQTHGFSYTSVAIRTLKARWGSCNNKQEITLNLYLMQLPWELIDYVILHELTHTKHLHHGADFWGLFETVYPGAKQFRKTLKSYKPAL